MPQRLKSLELHGYKTFASRTDFLFAEAVTAIVGPNGSGKSNIADALRWVLGEQSFSLLRGKKTEDMIFAGSEQRARAGMASATILFDNADGWLPIDFSEVAITRRAYRDGDNEYLINGQRVRLKDVGELLAKSGLAERTYTVIGQGLVDAVLSLKAEERRRLFEEAAGIGLYRSRREEALRRLEATRHNLERVQDILAELQPRLRSLERQARRVQEYEQLKADLRVLLREWYGYHWHRAQQELGESKESARVQETELAAAKNRHAGMDNELSALRGKLLDLRARLNTWHRQSAQLHTRREGVSRDLAVAEERARSQTVQQQLDAGELTRVSEEISLHTGRLAEAEQAAAALAGELGEAVAQLELARSEFQVRQGERSALEKEIQNTRQALGALGNRQSQAQARLGERQAQAQRMEQQVAGMAQAEAKARADLKESENRLRQVSEAQQAAEAARQAAEDALRQQRERVVQAESEQKKADSAVAAAQALAARMRAQLEVLEQAERELAGYADGARLLLSAARQAKLSGVRGALSAALEAPPEFEAALAAALGEYLDAVVLESDGDVDAALGALGTEQARGALLPLGNLTPLPPLAPPAGMEGVFGLAADLVSAPPELRPVVELLLGRVWVARDRAVARQLLAGRKAASDELRVVTLRGEVFHAGGAITAGHQSKSGMLSRPRQRRELQTSFSTAQVQLTEAENHRSQSLAGLNRLRNEEQPILRELETCREKEKSTSTARNQEELNVEKARRQLLWQVEQGERLRAEIQRGAGEARQAEEEIAQLEGQIAAAREKLRQQNSALAGISLDEAQSRLSHWVTRQAVSAQANSDAAGRVRERQSTVEQARQRRSAVEKRLEELKASVQTLVTEQAAYHQEAGKINAEIEAVRVWIEPAEIELEQLEAQQAAQQTREAAARQTLSLAEHRHAQARIALARRQEALDSLRQRIEDDFGLVAFEYNEQISGQTPLPLDGWVELLPVHREPAELPPDAEENIKRLRAQLRRMGSVNFEAQSEYDQVKERFEFLTVQVADSHAAEIGIKEVIAELDVLMEREFRKTFDAVAVEFRQIFTRLFGGGSAKLVLTDPEDLTATGIDIEARLPGRREQGLSLLSGGERSLAAAALVFSLLKVSPTPFCVLDEVDAMLDEANVGRFRDLLRELSLQTQFVIITHNRNTVQVADAIYGVTMGPESASQVVSLKLDEVSQVVE